MDSGVCVPQPAPQNHSYSPAPPKEDDRLQVWHCALAGAMDEVDWLKSRLEHLETTILAQGPGKGESLGRPMSRRGRSAKETQASDAGAQDYSRSQKAAEEGEVQPQITVPRAVHEGTETHDELTGPADMSAGGDTLSLDDHAASDSLQLSMEAAYDSEEAGKPKRRSELQTADKRLAHAQPTSKYTASEIASEGEEASIQGARE